MKQEYIEKIYAGWLAKVIGVRLGAPIEGWTYEKIKHVYGEIHDYLVNYRDFAADDDTNGPLFFLRALEDGAHGRELEAQDVGEALLNYAPCERGFFWWGGYGISTEHTAYLNLRNGIKAPKSGSIELNGSTTAEQIGGQIFIDSWGLVTPGNTELAARYAEKAASVTHDGNGVYGGIFIAVCISHAFEERDIHAILRKGLSYIPADCEYARVVNAVIDFHTNHPGDWREGYRFVYENFGYDKYPGNCHIIPNTGVMMVALLYGKGDFSDTINICNMCGWDTDCNVGNVAAIMGVRGGLEAIDFMRWRAPINDLLICSSVVGSLNIMDIPFGASYMARLAYKIAGEQPPSPWQELWEDGLDGCHFEYPGSTHAMRLRGECPDAAPEYSLTNTDEAAYTGSRSLKAVVKHADAAKQVFLYKKTYYTPADFHDSRYDPSFSPLLYPGQTITGSVFLPEYAQPCCARLYARDKRSGTVYQGECVTLTKGQWHTLSYTLPALSGALLDEAGFILALAAEHNPGEREMAVLMDDLRFSGMPAYTIELDKENEEVWNGLHREISQFTKLKGHMYLNGGTLCLSCADFAEAYTGHYQWTDYTAEFALTPVTGSWHMVNIRVQGGIRSYAAGLTEGGKLGLYKNANGYEKLAETELDWECGKEYILSVTAFQNTLTVTVDGQTIRFTDSGRPYLTGSVGLSVRNGSLSRCRYIKIS